ncbi:hypothetical protein ILYODFUR_002615 [Ilyodon furcidens]|uniref:Uncharacterized protein n=1 Tax=Ilyodon furcidens TaxID=33524 RepID=A0ABV0U2T4_9TELE
MCIFNTLPANIFSSCTNIAAVAAAERTSPETVAADSRGCRVCSSRRASVLTLAPSQPPIVNPTTTQEGKEGGTYQLRPIFSGSRPGCRCGGKRVTRSRKLGERGGRDAAMFPWDGSRTYNGCVEY